MQILIALCSNFLETMTVVVFGEPLGFNHIWWKNESMLTSLRSCVRLGSPAVRVLHR